jgi:hypothetical protein
MASSPPEVEPTLTTNPTYFFDLAPTLVFTLTSTPLLPDAFRNARAQLLVTRLPSKPVKGVADVPALAMTGEYSLGEAGDNLSFTEFDAFMSSAQAHLGGAKEVFVEDAALGTQVHAAYTLTHSVFPSMGARLSHLLYPLLLPFPFPSFYCTRRQRVWVRGW